MWWSRRTTLLALALAVGACGYAPVYGPQGNGAILQDALRLEAPQDEREYAFNRRIEDRLGRGIRWALSVKIDVSETPLGITSTGNTTRYRKVGRATYTLVDPATAETLVSGSTSGFTGYSTSGSTVATVASERDAAERLAILLADQVIDALLLADLPR